MFGIQFKTAYLQSRDPISRGLTLNRRYILLGKEFQPILQQDAALLLIPVFGGKSGMFGERAAFFIFMGPDSDNAVLTHDFGF